MAGRSCGPPIASALSLPAFSADRAGAVTVATVVVSVSDPYSKTREWRIVVKRSIDSSLVISPSSLPIFTLAAGRTGDIQTMTVSGGSGNYSLSVSSGRSGSPLRMSSGDALNLGSPLSSLGAGLVTLTATLGASDNDIDGLSAPPVTAVLLGVPALSLASSVKSDFVLLTSAAGDMPLLTLADLLAAVGGGLPPYQLGTTTMTGGITLSAGVLRLSSPGGANERRAATIRVRDGTTFNMLDFVLNVRFEPPFGFRNAATVLAVAEDYSGVVRTLTAAAIGSSATVMYSTATPDVSVGGSDGVLNLATPLAGNDKGVTVTATDGNLTVTHVLTLRSVSPLVLSLPPTLYVPASEDFWTSPTPLTVTGGGGGGATVFQTFSESGLYDIDAEGIVNVVPFELKKVGISEAAFTVSVSQPAVIGGRTTADILNIFVYDSLSVAYLPTLTVEFGQTGDGCKWRRHAGGRFGVLRFFGGQRRGDGDGRGGRGAPFVDGVDDVDDAVGGGGGDGPGFDCAGGFGDGGVGVEVCRSGFVGGV